MMESWYWGPGVSTLSFQGLENKTNSKGQRVNENSAQHH